MLQDHVIKGQYESMVGRFSWCFTTVKRFVSIGILIEDNNFQFAK